MCEDRAATKRLLLWAQERIPVAAQLLKFASVGGFATVVHVVAYIAFVEKLNQAPLIANVAAFGSAVLFSFFGHANWTFRGAYKTTERARVSTFGRFLICAILGLVLNTVFVYLVVTVGGLAYGWAIPFFAVVTPFLLYLINRYWVFGE